MAATTTTIQGMQPGDEMFTGQFRSTITGAETNQLKTGGGKISHVTVWNVGTTATVDVYDSASTTANKVFEWVSADGKGTFALQCPMTNGIRVVAGGTPASFNIVWS